ncbi:uncharacterized protein ARMOST_08224 [Armillaria ostoyae]|uniref:HAT C-terminal dimerisation domain-containing protein n=1 Tax=Armillaria ostoyae TaxID=47428 RepID=A0A284R841_ARMOS|nr:uncharacterized protein ARMOST_08224 [Armillaria ostoyae]
MDKSTNSEHEWLILEQCSKYLDEFKKNTLKFLYGNKPMIFEVFPAIDKLTCKLERGRENQRLHPAVRLACWNALVVLNSYYSKTDESHIYRIAMVMHPSHKMQYFLQQKWKSDWVDEALNMVRDEWRFFNAYFWHVPKPSTAGTTATSQRKHRKFSWDTDSEDEDETDALSVAMTADPLELYLHSPVLESISDPLMYWTSQNPATNPLAHFALDFLSVPATSVNCEHSFSAGSRNVSRFRHSLSDTSVCAATVLGSWASVGLIPRDEIIEGIHMKGPCWWVEEDDSEGEDDNNEDSDIVEVMDVDRST